MSQPEHNADAATMDEAIDWYLKHRSQELSIADRQAFVAWLRFSALNIREYLAIAALSKELPAAADISLVLLNALVERGRQQPTNVVALTALPASSGVGAGHLKDLCQQYQYRPSGSLQGRSTWMAHLPAIAAALLITVGAVWYFFIRSEQYQTLLGEQRTVRLTDGSLMHLNANSRASIHYSTTQRRIDIDRGQLMFEVVHDPARPFRVRAGNTEVLALGTKFDVYRQPDEVTVTVIEGRVAVTPQPTAPSLRKLGALLREGSLLRNERSSGEGAFVLTPIKLDAGEQLRIGPKPAMLRPSSVDVPAATAWLQGNIKFLRKPLAEVADEFNLYSPTPIEIEGEALRQLRVSGIFNAYDTESFLEFVRRMDGVEVQTGPDHIRIVSRGSAQ